MKWRTGADAKGPRGGCGAAAGAGVAGAEQTSGLRFSEVEDDDDMLEGVL